MKPKFLIYLILARRGTTANSAKLRAVGEIANAAPLSGGEWELIAPYGEFPTADRKKIQRFGRAEADAMVATFNSAWHRVATLFRGVPIFHGHPDVDPKSWPDDRRLGKITALDARPDGLWGKPEYNALGIENKAEGWWVYPSPAWLFPRTAANTISPDELLSIGLVNTPNIPGSVPWTNSETFEDDDGHEDPPSPDITNDTEMKNKLAPLVGLDPATATDDQVLAAVTTLKTAAEAQATADTNLAAANSAKTAAETELAAEKAKLVTANAEAAKVRKDAAEALVANAIRSGAITEAEREATTNSLVAPGADLVALGKALGDKQTAINTGHLDLGGRKVAISNARERQAAIQGEVSARMKRDGASYDAAYNSVKTDPQFALLFEAMKQPATPEA